MAVYPCAVGLHRYGGAQQSAYLGLVSSSRTESAKQRLCTPHFMKLRAYLEERTLLVAIGDISQEDLLGTPDSCFGCKSEAKPWTAYGRVYPRGEEHREYWALFCDACATSFAAMAQITL